MQEVDKLQELYLLKENAVHHLTAKDYSSALPYFQDILRKFQKAIQSI